MKKFISSNIFYNTYNRYKHYNYYRFLIRFWPQIALLAVVLLLFVTNYKLGTYLTGWDNLHPEFDFGTNIGRSIFAVWQEYQGLGLLGGMGHASDLVHQLILLLLSFLFPNSILRYLWTFLMLYLGALGAFYLLKNLIFHNYESRIMNHPSTPLRTSELGKSKAGDVLGRVPGSAHLDEYQAALAGGKSATGPASLETSKLDPKPYKLYAIPYTLFPFLGALFYLLNLATVQTFYAPFEAFIAHFAALPWLLLSSILFFQHQTRKRLLFLSIVLLLTTPQAYIPTLFVVYLLALAVILLPLVISSILKELRIKTSESWKTEAGDALGRDPDSAHLDKHQAALTGGKSATGPASSKTSKLYPIRYTIYALFRLGAIILIINAFWLLPFLYFTTTSVNTTIDSKINQMATETVFLQNKEFGNLTDVMLLKGFWFNNTDPNFSGNFVYMLAPWRDYYTAPLPNIVGMLLFVMMLIGAWYTITLRKTLALSCVLLFIFSVTMLATNTIPFSWVDSAFRNLPLLNQAFRFPFTKFSILAGLSYSIMLTFSLVILFELFSKLVHKPLFEHLTGHAHVIRRHSLAVFTALTILAIVIPVLPVAGGNLIYFKEKLETPRQYFQLFHFFHKQDPNTRIANLPQYTYWGWNFYTWGYGGSGFLWYGLAQPILDRAFDVWSLKDEGYYFELSQALYSKNSYLLGQVLQKYQINWLVLDRSVTYSPAPGALMTAETDNLLAQLPNVKKVEDFGDISVYKVTLTTQPKSFVFFAKNLKRTNSYMLANHDQAYLDLGTYDTAIPTKAIATDIFYPFRSLFSYKTPQDLPVTVTTTKKYLTIQTELAKESYSKLSIPSYSAKELMMEATLTATHDAKQNLILSITANPPQIMLDGKKLWGKPLSYELFTIPKGSSYPQRLRVNGLLQFPIYDANTTFDSTYITTIADNTFELSDDEDSVTKILPQSVLSSSAGIQAKIVPINDKTPNKISVTVPFVSDHFAGSTIHLGAQSATIQNCDSFRSGTIEPSDPNKSEITLAATNASACISHALPSFPHGFAYAMIVKSTHVTGRGLHVWLLADDTKYTVFETYLPERSGEATNVFLIPPLDLYGKSYSLHFDSSSIGQEKTVNTVKEVLLTPIPYSFISSIQFQNTDELNPPTLGLPTAVSHPNQSLYQIHGSGDTDTVAVLSQAYDPGWNAFLIQNQALPGFLQQTVPFLVGRRLSDHLLINNWENGWSLNQPITPSDTVVLVYLPQYLEYAGFGILVLFGLILWLKRPPRRKKRHYKSPPTLPHQAQKQPEEQPLPSLEELYS